MAKNISKSMIGLTGMLLASCAMPGWALAQDGAASSAMQDDRQTATIEDIVVTARKLEERLLDVPLPISVIGGAGLSETGQVLLRDYYTKVPGMSYAPNYNSQQNIAIRGITTGGLNNATTGIMIDEVPFLDFAQFDFDPADLQRIEVLRGPQGTLYGASGMGGVIRYITKDPDPRSISGRVSAGLSSVAHGGDLGYQLRGSLNVPVTPELAVIVNGFARRDAGYIDNPAYGQKDVNETLTKGGMVTALWKPTADISLRVNALYQRAEADGLFEEVTGLGRFEQNYLPGAGASDRKIQAYNATLNVDVGAVKLTSATGYSREERYGSNDVSQVFGFISSLTRGTSNDFYFEEPTYSRFTQELRFSGALWDKLDWLVGGFYSHEKVHDRSFINLLAPVTLDEIETWFATDQGQTRKEYAGFANLTYRFTDSFDVQVGGRYGSYKVRTREFTTAGNFVPDVTGFPSPITQPPTQAKDNVFTYLVSPRLKLGPDVMLYARVADGYRIGDSNTPLPGIPKASKPDRTTNYEIGAKAELLDRRLTLDFSAYRIDWTDIQIQGIRGFPYYTNGGKAKSEGVEFAVTSRPWSGMSLDGWISYNNARLTNAFPAGSSESGSAGDRLPFSAHLTGNISAEQALPLSDDIDMFAGGSVSYVGERFGQFTAAPIVRERYDDYFNVDLKIGLRSKGWSATLYANNIFDQHTVLQGGAGYQNPFAKIYTIPRTVGVTVAGNF